MMRQENFRKQFPEGINSLSLLHGWIPRMNTEKQKGIIRNIRLNRCNDLKKGLEILALNGTGQQ
jgi:hypothetical protein